MPFASPPSYDFGDGADAGSSTELGNAKRVGANVEVTGLGAATAATFDGAKLKVRIAEIKTLIAADPTRGIPGMDVQDDPALAVDPKTIGYTEATSSPTVPVVTLKDAGVSKVMLPSTLDGLESALAALGF